METAVIILIVVVLWVGLTFRSYASWQKVRWYDLLVVAAIFLLSHAAGYWLDASGSLSGIAAAILGGVGRPYGALVGGLIIGLAEEISSYPFIGTEPLLNPGYKAGVAFAIMIGILIWRPSGLFKGKVF